MLLEEILTAQECLCTIKRRTMLLGFGGCLQLPSSGGPVLSRKMRWGQSNYKSLKIASHHVGARQFAWSRVGLMVGFDLSSESFDAQEILPGKIWLGSARAATDPQMLAAHNIKYVFTVASRLVCTDTADSEASLVSDHAVLEVDDKPEVDLLSHLNEALAWLDHVLSKNKGAVLIHCAQGVSRSVSVCVAYLMARKKMSLKSALKYVRSRRAVANPNVGFRRQLKLFEENDCDGLKATKASLEQKLAALFVV